MPNRLASETSPYLLQHKDNPVDWYPWGDEALQKAKAEDKPIFLSVGYSSCHWCHVMEHESFESQDVADRLNAGFVSIKVDREERPDLDDAYMVAVQLSSGRGGWPMSVFLTPSGLPFFAGTYFPKLPREGHPGFLEILDQIASMWNQERAKIMEVAGQFDASMRANAARESPPTTLSWPELLDNCVRTLSMDFDEDHGGFGQAPKFPPHTAIEFLLEYAVSDFGSEELRQTAADQALYTLEAMALGGIHDHVGGGFHRYSTDERWLVPHFEKMLYDNALMLGNYARAAALCEEQLPELEGLFARTAEGIVRWVREDMTSPEGLFYSALDADSEGEEGKYYTWSYEEVQGILGSGAKKFFDAYQFRREGNFRDEATGRVMGVNIPHLLETGSADFGKELSLLSTARAKRIRPQLDHKAIVAWNGLMIGAMAQAAEIGLAEKAAEAVLKFERMHGALPHQITSGQPSGRAFLDDYAYFIGGLISLSEVKSVFEQESVTATGRPSSFWLDEAGRLAADMKAKFKAADGMGFYSTASDHEHLFGRTKPIFDQPMPSANAVAARCLIDLEDFDTAKNAIESVAGWIERAPAATEAHCLAILKLLERQGTAGHGLENDGQVSLSVDRGRLMAINEVGEAILRIQIPQGLHINSSHPTADWLTPTSLHVTQLPFRAHFPDADGDRYTGYLEIPFEVDLPEGIASAEFDLTVKYQACSESECQLPQEWHWQGLIQAT